MACAPRHKLVSVHPGPALSGVKNTICGATSPLQRARSRLSSPMLARVHAHLGCANITSVALVLSREIPLRAGQCLGAVAAPPGMRSYLAIPESPAATARNQE